MKRHDVSFERKRHCSFASRRSCSASLVRRVISSAFPTSITSLFEYKSSNRSFAWMPSSLGRTLRTLAFHTLLGPNFCLKVLLMRLFDGVSALKESPSSALAVCSKSTTIVQTSTRTDLMVRICDAAHLMPWVPPILSRSSSRIAAICSRL